MNKYWDEYMQRINNEYKKLSPEAKKHFSYDNSRVTERIMRLWKEARAFGAIPPEYEALALATLKEDFIEMYK